MLYKAIGLGEFRYDVISEQKSRKWWAELLQNWEEELNQFLENEQKVAGGEEDRLIQTGEVVRAKATIWNL